jgi:hypothetical protein
MGAHLRRQPVILELFAVPAETTPRCSRPPDSTSTVATVLARAIASCSATSETHVPISSEVRAATNDSAVYGSQKRA